MAEQIKAESEQIKTSSNDDELDELLDNALQDFDKHAQAPPSSDKQKKPAAESTAKSDVGNIPLPSDIKDVLPDLMDEDSVRKLMSQFEQTFKSLITEGDDEDAAEFSEQLSKDFKKLAEDTMKELKEDTGTSESEFSATITETLENLSKNAGSLQGNGNDLIDMLGALGFDGAEGAGSVPSDFPSLFNNIMQMFLSKDILYPSLKELVNKYPEWLEENKSSLCTEDYTRYSKQLEIMTKVCAELEQASESDDDEVRSKRFNIILGLMQQMQDYGHPPKSLMGDALEIPNWL